jgi:hypothetical protein
MKGIYRMGVGTKFEFFMIFLDFWSSNGKKGLIF